MVVTTPCVNKESVVKAVTRFILLVLASFTCLCGCGTGGENKYEEPPPQKVYVSQPLQHDVIDYVDETGTTEAVETVEIRARVEGYLEEINFEPGQTNITPGYELYRIDQKPYKATVTQAQAALKVAQAEAKDAEAKYARAQVLAPKGAMSEEEVMERGAAVDVAKAAIEAAQAALEAAELDLSYTVVKSPIAGRVGKTLVDKGNLVGKSLTTHLTTVINYDPIYATFNISERLFLDLKQQAAERGEKDDAEMRQVKIFMGLENEEGYPHEGYLNYVDLAVDASSGTYLIRGVFPNPNYDIVPGSFARVRIPVGKRENALLVPESATGADQEGRYVLAVVENEGVQEVERRGVTLGAKFGSMRVVLSGLDASDTLVVRGVQRVRPGSKVDPVQETLELPKELMEAESDPTKNVDDPQADSAKTSPTGDAPKAAAKKS
jgi:RND family efflux transporter MFP subunit